MLRRFLAAGMAVATLFALPAAASAASPDLVVSQVYGGGGNTGATYSHDFVELFNRGEADVSLAGKSIQYASATGTGQFGNNATQLTELPDVTLRPGEYLLVQEATNDPTVGNPLFADFVDPTPIAMAGGAGKVAVVTGTTSLGCNGGSTACDAGQLARIIDLVGYGNANFFEGAGAAPTLNSTTSAIRLNGGCKDTDQNAADFAAQSPPTPRGLQTPLAPCLGDTAPSVESTTPASGASDVPLDASLTVGFSEPVTVGASAFSLSCDDSGVHALTVDGGPQSYTLDPDGTFTRAEECTLTVDADSVRDTDGDDPPDTMGSDATISFTTLGQELKIREIQGVGHVSPHLGAVVSNVQGVVTARRNNGFFIQDPQPDADEKTSEGLFVFTSSRPAAEIAVGQAVRVNGTVGEFRGAANALGLTQIQGGPRVTVTGDGAPIAPTLLGDGGRVPPNRIIDNDSIGDVDVNPFFDPEQDGIDFYEAVEGMLVRVNRPYAVGPTASFGEIPVVADGGRRAGPYTARGGLIISSRDFNPERMHLDDEVLRALSTPFPPMPLADVGDTISDVQAVVDYSFGNFKLQVTSQPSVVKDGGLQKETTQAPRHEELAVGSFNVENLTPLGSNPSQAQRDKYAALARTLVTHMRAPDIVAVEEIQDNNGTSGGTNSPVVDASQTWADLIGAISAAGGPAYEYRQIDPVAHQDGGAPGGNIRVGFLFRTDRGLEFVDRGAAGPTDATQVVDTPTGPQLTLSPGRIQPADDAWLASRKPLAGEFRWRGETVFAVANHFASKGGDDPLFGHSQPPVRHTEIGPDGRHRQATLVNEFVRQVLAADKRARVLVLGDINDFEFSETTEILESRGALTSLYRLLPKRERYSYVFEGNSQVLDQILVSQAVLRTRPEFDSVHINAEFADQTSDHDPQVARIELDDDRDDDEDGDGDDDDGDDDD